MNDKIYTLVVRGECPALGVNTAVLFHTNGHSLCGGIVDSVLFSGNALSINEQLEARITELENALLEAADEYRDLCNPPAHDVELEQSRMDRVAKYRAIAKGEKK